MIKSLEGSLLLLEMMEKKFAMDSLSTFPELSAILFRSFSFGAKIISTMNKEQEFSEKTCYNCLLQVAYIKI